MTGQEIIKAIRENDAYIRMSMMDAKIKACKNSIATVQGLPLPYPEEVEKAIQMEERNRINGELYSYHGIEML